MLPRFPVFLAAALALTSCSAKKEPPPCPPIFILGDAKQVTKFLPGKGRDLTDVMGQAEIVGWTGSCSYKPREKEGGFLISMDVQVAFDVKKGPANKGKTLDLSYFVAMPAFFPKPEAKSVLPVTITFPDGINTVHYVDEAVNLTVPVKEKELIDTYEIYLGFQTSADELLYNRVEK